MWWSHYIGIIIQSQRKFPSGSEKDIFVLPQDVAEPQYETSEAYLYSMHWLSWACDFGWCAQQIRSDIVDHCNHRELGLAQPLCRKGCCLGQSDHSTQYRAGGTGSKWLCVTVLWNWHTPVCPNTTPTVQYTIIHIHLLTLLTYLVWLRIYDDWVG